MRRRTQCKGVGVRWLGLFVKRSFVDPHKQAKKRHSEKRTVFETLPLKKKKGGIRRKKRGVVRGEGEEEIGFTRSI